METMAIKVFKTSVKNEEELSLIKNALVELLGADGTWNFDLEDCDKILRVDSLPDDKTKSLIGVLELHGFSCEEL